MAAGIRNKAPRKSLVSVCEHGIQPSRPPCTLQRAKQEQAHMGIAVPTAAVVLGISLAGLACTPGVKPSIPADLSPISPDATLDVASICGEVLSPDRQLKVEQLNAHRVTLAPFEGEPFLAVESYRLLTSEEFMTERPGLVDRDLGPGDPGCVWRFAYRGLGTFFPPSIFVVGPPGPTAVPGPTTVTVYSDGKTGRELGISASADGPP